MPFRHTIRTSTLTGLVLFLAIVPPLTAADRAAIEAVPIPQQFDIPAVRAARDACVSDAQRLCPEVVAGGGRIIRCLAAQKEGLSPICRTAVETARIALGL